LTDGQGRTVNFSNTVLIMTSNMPGDPLSVFKPEFVNRIDEIERFRSLERSDLTQIVDIQLALLAKRLLDRRLTLDVSEDAKVWLGDHGYDAAFGARPLRRVIQRSVGDPLAVALLEGRFSDGDSVHMGVAENGEALVLS
jgi:ATP-dependent Clp protease ATP-binding subunit ClpB